LRELTLDENPATKSRFSYKYDVLWALKLAKLDHEAVTEKDYSLSKAFNLSKSKETENENEIQLN